MEKIEVINIITVNNYVIGIILFVISIEAKKPFLFYYGLGLISVTYAVAVVYNYTFYKKKGF